MKHNIKEEQKKTFVMVKKVVLLVAVSLMLVGCSGADGIKDGKFTFDEEDFQEAYEEETGKLMPDTVRMTEGNVSIGSATYSEVIDFLSTANELIGDDKIDKLLNTIEDKGLEASEDAESDDLFIIADEDSAMIMTKDRE